jgi:hypothetical protein
VNQLLALFMSNLKADKGRDINRTLVLLGVAWCVIQLNDVNKRITGIESRLAAAHIARTSDSAGVTGPGVVTPGATLAQLQKPSSDAPSPEN